MTELERRRVELEQLTPLPQGPRRDWADVCTRAQIGASPLLHRKRLALALLILAALAVPTYAIGRALSGWLGGEPAPTAIVDNFGSYTPQLGFRPDAGQAVRVASDGAFVLYATPNDRGSYCVATATPDGGICVSPDVASAPLVAGIMPAGRATLVAGRVKDAHAVAVIFSDSHGDSVRRQLGVGGFFLAALDAPAQNLCESGDWTTRFQALDAHGNVTTTAKITLASRPKGAPPGVLCGMVNGPHT